MSIEKIKEEYHKGDVCMSELLASIPADTLSIEKAFELYIAAMQWADGDIFLVLKQ